MLYVLAADLVALLHLAFIGFVMVGGFLRGRSVWIRWLHPPAMLWAIALSLFGWTCPLTPLENALLARAGQTTYEGGFIAHYLLPILYPEGLDRFAQAMLAGLVIGINLIAYVGTTLRSRRRSGSADGDASGRS
jgi:hypothetical protein